MLSTIAGGLAVAAILAGLGFFLTGSLGVLRLEDPLARLHAVSKADNLGLGLVCLGLALLAETPVAAALTLLVWPLAMLSGGVAAQLVAEASTRAEPRDEPRDKR